MHESANESRNDSRNDSRNEPSREAANAPVFTETSSDAWAYQFRHFPRPAGSTWTT